MNNPLEQRGVGLPPGERPRCLTLAACTFLWGLPSERTLHPVFCYTDVNSDERDPTIVLWNMADIQLLTRYR